ncbi:SulP family inorganic anion transporter [Paraburkholderia diazotrophica]|uniref:High affinity sulphate transporter 1 n=1 Tax=Paraburkholderia diazotrophica TaxID=667676 RepID=A0A1H6XYW8_9BURK|nr:SulP family inorganic anion transporter [Paraburkholderia diazotrophica]SEJ34241.1 high affinity sulphate transporter 1 [Paraburkholderia diazotrophica]
MSRMTSNSSGADVGSLNRLLRRMPGIATLRSYQRAWFSHDVVAGLVLTTVLVPAGLGYAEAARLPAISGLYATVAGIVAYALFGPSRILVLGPDSALAALIASIVLPLAGAHTERLLVLASMLAILSGVFCIAVGVCRLGFVTDLLSRPIRQGYLNGVALTVIISQTPKLLGFDVAGSNLVQEAAGLVHGVFNGQLNSVTCLIGVACLLVIFGFKRWLPVVPGILVAVVGATLAVALFDLDRRAGVAVVGNVPQGLPLPSVPLVSLDEIVALLPGAIAIALISLADIAVLSRVFAERHHESVDRDQELVALGAANIVTGLFQGFPVTSSASRTPVAESAGAKTQITGIVAALCVSALLIFAPTLLRTLPAAALGAVVVAAGLALFEVRDVIRLRRLRRSEFVQSIACFAGVALIGPIQGIFIAVGLALMAFVWRAWRPYDAVLGRVDGRKGYHDISRHPEARTIPGLVLFRWDAPLFFANAEIFREHVQRAIASTMTPAQWVVVAAEPITDIDITAAEALADLRARLRERQIELCFAEMKGPVKDMLRQYEMFDRLGGETFFPTLGVAVDKYLEHHDVDWHDWDDDGAEPRQGTADDKKTSAP